MNHLAKKIIFLFICSTGLTLQARQLYTVKSGSWNSDSVWYNQMIPTSNNDTILIRHHISLNSDVIMDDGDFLTIDTSGVLCGNYNMVFTGNAFFVNEGLLGLHSLALRGGACLNTGYIDIGDSTLSVNEPASFYNDTGCVYVHFGPQQCLFTGLLVDTNMQINISDDTVTIDVSGMYGNSYQFNFSDGGSVTANNNVATYTFSDSGTYNMRAIFMGDCLSDTLNETIHITYTPPPPPPPCDTDSILTINPNPADWGSTLQANPCSDESGMVKIYSLNGRLIYSRDIQTVNKSFTQQISTKILANGVYIAHVQLGSRSYVRKLMVLHQGGGE